MPNLVLNANITECPNPNPDPATDQLNIDITSLVQGQPGGVGFANIDYSTLTVPQKATVDAFVLLMKTLCV